MHCSSKSPGVIFRPTQRGANLRRNASPRLPACLVSAARTPILRRCRRPRAHLATGAHPCPPSADDPSCRWPPLSAPRGSGAAVAPAARAAAGASAATSFPKASPRAIPTPTASSSGRAGRSPRGRTSAILTVEVAEDEAFNHVIATARGAHLRRLRLDLPRAGRRPEPPRSVYWYRFTDERRQRQPRRPHDHRAGRATIRARCASPSSAARTSTRARRTPIAA